MWVTERAAWRGGVWRCKNVMLAPSLGAGGGTAEALSLSWWRLSPGVSPTRESPGHCLVADTNVEPGAAGEGGRQFPLGP